MNAADLGHDGELRQYLSFSVGQEAYGLELLRVKEVIRVHEITSLPRTPSSVKGIINLRGDIIPVVDLRDRLGLEGRAPTAQTRVIVVEVEGRLMGMVVDSASQVVRIPVDQIDAPPPVLGGLSQDFIRGVGKTGDGIVILLNVDAILTMDEHGAVSSRDSALTADRA